MTIRLSGETEARQVLRTPSASDITSRNTVTTRATPRIVIAVETFRTIRLRRLYFSGIPISHHLPQSVDDRDARGANRREESRQRADGHGGGHGRQDGRQ